MKSNYEVVCITGTPGVGKTTISEHLNNELAKNYDCQMISINDIAIDNDLIIGYNKEKDFKVVDIDKLDEKFNIIINNTVKDYSNENTSNKYDIRKKIIIVDGHLSHLCSKCDKVIALRLDPIILEKRLIEKNYSTDKIKDNLESEALAICSYEAYEIHNNKVNEINTSNLTINEVLQLSIKIIEDEKHFPPGKIDFMDWFLEHE
jgi:adenylate kinase